MLQRDMANRLLGGVCAGVARHMGLDISLVRLLFGFGALVWGLTIPIYILMWIIIPNDGSPPRNILDL